MNKKQLSKFKEEIEQARDDLIQRVQKTETYGREADGEGEARDLADQASSSYTKELMFSMSNSDRRMLQAMQDALDRIDSGDFGECQNCGETIGKKRLDAVPWALLCITCKELEEQGRLN